MRKKEQIIEIEDKNIKLYNQNKELVKAINENREKIEYLVDCQEIRLKYDIPNKIENIK